MKWKRHLGILFVVIVGVMSISPSKAKYHTVEVDINIESFQYEDLKNYATEIILVEVTDDLTRDNSTIEMGFENQFLDFYAERSAVVKRSYKGSYIQGEEIAFLEQAAVSKRREEIVPRGYDSLQKSTKVVLFLRPSTIEGKKMIVASKNGVIKTDNLSENALPGIAYQFAVDYGTDRSSDPQIDDIIRARSSGMLTEFTNTKTKIIHTDFGIVAFQYIYRPADQTTYYQFDGAEMITYGSREY